MQRSAGAVTPKEQVQLQIQRATIVLAPSTYKSSNDEWFDWRLQIARKNGKPVIPIYFYQGARSPLLAECQGISSPITLGDDWSDLVSYLALLLPKVKCFVSYSRADDKFVNRLTSDLRSHRIAVWRDADSIPAGSSWDAEIEKALSKCSHVLLVATPAAISSPNVIDEIGFALNKKKTVVPLRVEDCELPLRVHRAQWIDFRDPEQYETSLKQLLDQLREI
jgi:hypothetical protein